MACAGDPVVIAVAAPTSGRCSPTAVLDTQPTKRRRWPIVLPLAPASTFVPRRTRAELLRRVGAVLIVLGCGGPGSEARQALPSPPAATSAPDAWGRVFLADGQVLATHGEHTRVDDVVVLQVPLDLPTGGTTPQTRTVTLPASAIDWPRTDAYRDAIRRAQFERTGGERAYAAFTEDVAATLREVAQVPDPLERIRRLAAARARLAQWPAAHHGYRAEEVAQTLSVVDDLLNGMRAAAGQQTFDLALTSSTAPPVAAATTLLPPPTLQEVVTQSVGLAPRISDAGERLALLEATAGLLASRANGLDARWAREARRQVDRQISREHRVTRAYARLRTWMLEKTTKLLALADVRGLMRVRDDVQARAARLDGQRPEEVQAMLGTLDARLEAARRQRLLIERWQERRPALERYASVVSRHVAVHEALPRALEEVKALSGPGPTLLTQAEGRLAGARADAGLLVVPEEARAIQQVWTSAQQLAARALETRRAAIRSGDLQQAWAASAAAAGALMLLQQLRGDLAALVRPPSPPGQGS